MRFLPGILFLTLLMLLGSCSGEKKAATPLETFKTYTKAIKQKDTATMKLLLSAETLKMHDMQAKAQNTTLDDIVKRETLFSENQTTVEFRNEKIDGDKATLEVKNSSRKWETVPFVLEDGNWKIDKKGFADSIIQEVEQENQRQEDIFNQDRQP